MGLTNKATGKNVYEKSFKLDKNNTKIIALAGNPNVGKTTVFNELTGLNQHTGNWPGKTVTNAIGYYTYQNKKYTLVDLPGTYSLMAHSVEEEIARDFICFGNPDVTVVVVDATCLERNLNLVLQTLEITDKVVLCVNLMDEAKRKKIKIDLKKLEEILGIPVIGCSANKKIGLDELKDKIEKIAYNIEKTNPLKITYDEKIENKIKNLEPILKEKINNNINTRWLAIQLIDNNESLINSINTHLKLNLNNYFKQKDDNTLKDIIVTTLIKKAEEIASKVVTINNINDKTRKIDKYLTSKLYGIPIMIILLSFIFYLTIVGANIPSKFLANFLFTIQDHLSFFLLSLNIPTIIHDILIFGVFKTTAWIISVMLPPMAIFFPLFTLLEDLGYLPRIAFNLDKLFKKCSACGKQALTMCMGFGCNAAGVIGCRIIDSPRERLIAIITNNFVPCNGRFPTLIAIITMFFTGFVISPLQPIVSTIILTSIIILGIIMTFLVSKILSKTILKGIPSTFTLELPPYRKPQIGRIITRSIFDRTIFVLGRAITVAIPAGLIIWLMANIKIGNISILAHSANFLNPFAQLIGLDGYILMAFILGFPANEIVIPIIIMSYMATNSITDISNLTTLKTLLIDNGWTWVTAICVMLFSLMHWPCGTTCLTIKKETKSFKWTLISIIVPTIMGIVCCLVVNMVGKLVM